ncbi:MAG: imidazole glycerol phosphate synthase subunit HisH [bacterium]|nr:imidazole glycerol phosphate synthase subunit HisH [bacterium]
MIAIIDYGMGNLRSVQKAFEHLGYEARITHAPAEIVSANACVLPGVGAFRDAIKRLNQTGLDEVIRETIAEGKPFLGICLGMQLLFSRSYEYGEYEGLGIIEGTIDKFPPPLRVPHIGWNTVTESGMRKAECGLNTDAPTRGENPLFSGIPANSYFYFVHSYYVQPSKEDVTAATTEYGFEFTSMIRRDNLFATQFHPEKSQQTGLVMLRNFAQLAEKATFPKA